MTNERFGTDSSIAWEALEVIEEGTARRSIDVRVPSNRRRLRSNDVVSAWLGSKKQAEGGSVESYYSACTLLERVAYGRHEDGELFLTMYFSEV